MKQDLENVGLRNVGTSSDDVAVPTRRKCGAMEAHNRLLEEPPDFRRILGNLERATRARLAQPPAMPATPIKIPVVVHVVWRTDNERIGKPLYVGRSNVPYCLRK